LRCLGERGLALLSQRLFARAARGEATPASEFIYALAFVSPSHEKVVSTGVVTELVRGDVFFWQSLQAATILVAVPIAFVFNLFLDRFVAGFTMGAIKG
jgi:multiple sugar transport system permease protein